MSLIFAVIFLLELCHAFSTIPGSPAFLGVFETRHSFSSHSHASAPTVSVVR